MISANPWGILGGIKIGGFIEQFLNILFMGKLTFDWEFPNDMCQSMGIFHGNINY